MNAAFEFQWVIVDKQLTLKIDDNNRPMVLVVDREQQLFILKRVDLAEPIFDAKEITFFPSFKEKCVYNINLNKCFEMYIVYEKITFF